MNSLCRRQLYSAWSRQPRVSDLLELLPNDSFVTVYLCCRSNRRAGETRTVAGHIPSAGVLIRTILSRMRWLLFLFCFLYYGGHWVPKASISVDGAVDGRSIKCDKSGSFCNLIFNIVDVLVMTPSYDKYNNNILL